jgi:hypothetical protein
MFMPEHSERRQEHPTITLFHRAILEKIWDEISYGNGNQFKPGNGEADTT